jgi:putative lipoic acid-binding regulatory protein
MSQQPSEDTLLTFPCEFPIKVMGKRVDHFSQEIASVISQHAPDFDPVTIEMRVSSGGNYLSLTCTVMAHSKAQLDAIYLSLTSHPLVSVVL